MPRLLIFTGFFYPHLGGYDLIINELASRLHSYAYDIDLVTCNTENASTYEIYNGIYIYRLPSWNILNKSYTIPKPTFQSIKIFYKILKSDYDLVQTNTRFFPISLIGLVVSKIIDKPLLHIEYGSQHSVLSNRILTLLSEIYDHFIGAIILENAKGIICNCQASERFLRHLCAKCKISCIPIYGINQSIFQ